MIDLGLNGFWLAIAGVLGIGAAIWRAYAKGRTDANDKRDADDMADAYNRERTRHEIDRTTGGADARDKLRKDWRRY